jgi:phage baseplate assembly protein gpV
MMSLPTITIGEVIDNNDPQQMGRLKVRLLVDGGSTVQQQDQQTLVEDLPWANYASPFGGIVTDGFRGPTNEQTNGPVAYGFWGIPEIGSRVLLLVANNDPSQLFWIACIYPNSQTHTMPHGRYLADQQGNLSGPLSSSEQPIEPLNSKQKQAFEKPGYEWITRAADYSNSAAADFRVELDKSDPESIPTKQPDNQYTKVSLKNGVVFDRITGYNKNGKPCVTSIVTPGFHSISLDDREENCRVRIRTTTGHQLILDDTNERIYLSTMEGRNWIEMDADGHVYVYSEESVSIRAKGHINLTGDSSIRLFSNQSINLKSQGDVNIECDNFNVNAFSSIVTKTSSQYSKTDDLFLSSSSYKVLASTIALDGTTSVDGNFTARGSSVSLNGAIQLNGGISYGSPQSPINLTDPNMVPAQAKWTNIVPDHEPWGRMFTLNDYTHAPSKDYDDPSVGRDMKENGIRKRNPLWKR